jgi:hypothetical protein
MRECVSTIGIDKFVITLLITQVRACDKKKQWDALLLPYYVLLYLNDLVDESGTVCFIILRLFTAFKELISLSTHPSLT